MQQNTSAERIPIKIIKSFGLKGFISNLGWLNCDVSDTIKIGEETGNYACLSQGTRFGATYLGYIDQQTREFRKFEPEIAAGFDSKGSGGLGDKTMVYVPSTQLNKLSKIEEVLSIPGIFIK